MRWLLVLACACSSNHGTPTNGSGTPPTASGCDGAKPKIEQLYRSEAKAEKPERQAEAVSDNTTMVMNECVKAPAKVVACINRVSTSAELEKQCLAPLDDEGTEGEALRK
jgi:hypothetical protein